MKMKSNMNSLLLLLLVSPFSFGDTTYLLDRVIYDVCVDDRCHTVDTLNVEGYAEIIDTGPYTAIDAIEMDARACPKECTLDGGPLLFASPPPNCTCFNLFISTDKVSYIRNGQIYFFDLETTHILRRGSTATDSSDPALIVRLEEGETLIYREKDD